MRFYLASSIKNTHNACYFAKKLKEAGFTQTYDWTQNIVTGSSDADRREDYKRAALKEHSGVDSCDVLIALMPGERGTHVEIGMALAMAKPVIIVSEEPVTENPCSFYHHPGVITVISNADRESLVNAAITRLTEIGILLPCPFCGGKPKAFVGMSPEDWVECQRCGARVKAAYGSTVLSRWNTRKIIGGTL